MFNVDQLAEARVLDSHLKSLASRPISVARNTVVIVEQAAAIGPDLGPVPRPVTRATSP